MTNASTVAMNSSYPCGSPPPGGRKSRSPLARAMKPSRLVPIKTDAFTAESSCCHLTTTTLYENHTSRLGRRSRDPAVQAWPDAIDEEVGFASAHSKMVHA